jgi:LPXTG-motif cell wall-anchored protein
VAKASTGKKQVASRLASTGANLVVLMLIGAMCVGSSLLLMRRKTDL